MSDSNILPSAYKFWGSEKTTEILAAVTTPPGQSTLLAKLKTLGEGLLSNFVTLPTKGIIEPHLKWLFLVRVYIGLLKAFVHYFEQKYGISGWERAMQSLQYEPMSLKILEVVRQLSGCERDQIESSLIEVAQYGVAFSLPGNPEVELGHEDAGFNVFANMTGLVLKAMAGTEQVQPRISVNSGCRQKRRLRSLKLRFAEDGRAVITHPDDPTRKVTLQGKQARLLQFLSLKKYKKITYQSLAADKADNFLWESLWNKSYAPASEGGPNSTFRKLVSTTNSKITKELGIPVDEKAWIFRSRDYKAYILSNRLVQVDG